MTSDEARRILNFWEALDRVDPLPDPWRESAMVCYQIEKVVAAQYASAGAKYEMTKYEDFMPPQYTRLEKKKVKKGKQGPEDQIKALDSKFRN